MRVFPDLGKALCTIVSLPQRPRDGQAAGVGATRLANCKRGRHISWTTRPETYEIWQDASIVAIGASATPLKNSANARRTFMRSLRSKPIETTCASSLRYPGLAQAPHPPAAASAPPVGGARQFRFEPAVVLLFTRQHQRHPGDAPRLAPRQVRLVRGARAHPPSMGTKELGNRPFGRTSPLKQVFSQKYL
jgi:hypothetical protein